MAPASVPAERITMDAYALGEVTAARADTRSAAAAPWVHSARFDLLFLILSPLIALPILIISPTPSLLSLAFACVFGVPHYLSTFTFFFWDETRAQQRADWMLFFGGPVLIVASIAFVILFRVPFIIAVVVYVWNMIHVARQSCGILSIYRHRAGVKDPAIKPIVNSAILWTAAALAFWNPAGYPTLDRFMRTIWVHLPRAVWLIATTAAVVALVRLAASLAKRYRGPQRPQLPEMAFLGTSLLLFHPYLWIHNTEQATLGMLLGHFLQYLGLVWVVHRRKFAAAGDGRSQPWLARLSTNLPLLVAVLFISGAVSLGLRLVQAFPIALVYSAMLISLSLVHFYLDGLFWAFRRPEVRASLGPHLMGAPSPRVKAA